MIDSPCRVLVFSANQVNDALDTDNELRAIRNALPDAAVVDYLPATRADELVVDIRERKPNIIHFMGHGRPGGIELAHGRNDFRPVTGEALGQLFEGRGIQLVVLSSCYSASQAHQIEPAVVAVVGTPDRLEDESSQRFAAAFYRTLGRGGSVDEALRDGQDAVNLQNLSDRFVCLGDGSLRLRPSGESSVAVAPRSGPPAAIDSSPLADGPDTTVAVWRVAALGLAIGLAVLGLYLVIDGLRSAA